MFPASARGYRDNYLNKVPDSNPNGRKKDKQLLSIQPEANRPEAITSQRSDIRILCWNDLELTLAWLRYDLELTWE